MVIKCQIWSPTIFLNDTDNHVNHKKAIMKEKLIAMYCCPKWDFWAEYVNFVHLNYAWGFSDQRQGRSWVAITESFATFRISDPLCLVWVPKRLCPWNDTGRHISPASCMYIWMFSEDHNAMKIYRYQLMGGRSLLRRAQSNVNRQECYIQLTLLCDQFLPASRSETTTIGTLGHRIRRGPPTHDDLADQDAPVYAC